MARIRITYRTIDGKAEGYTLLSTYAFPALVRRIFKEGFILQSVYEKTVTIAPGAILQIEEKQE